MEREYGHQILPRDWDALAEGRTMDGTGKMRTTCKIRTIVRLPSSPYDLWMSTMELRGTQERVVGLGMQGSALSHSFVRVLPCSQASSSRTEGP